MDKKGLKFSYHPKILTSAVTALCTGLVASSVSQASDIDIYQKAKAGDITLMFVLDISGSMGYPQLQSDAGACDIPSNVVQTGYNSVLSSNGVAEYKRYYCTATAPTYYYMKSGTSWYSCGNSSSKSDCITKLKSQPSTSGLTSMSSNYNTYYYKAGPDTQYPDRITRVKDGMIDLLNGNASKGILPVSDDKLIGLTTFSRPTQFNSAGEPTSADNLRGQVRILARRLDAVVNGKTQRRILIEEIAKLGARGGTPTANAYAEAAASLMGTTTQGLSNSGF
ncbi:MAG: pilus assembly protein PilY, partial [Acinetobacter calcoaceticus]